MSVEFKRKVKIKISKEDDDPIMILIEFKGKVRQKLTKRMMMKLCIQYNSKERVKSN